MKWRFSAIALLLLVSMTGCIYDYSPEEISTKVADNTVVVIDGDIAVGSITTIRVNITEPLLEEEKNLPLGATVWVEEEGGALYHGQEKADETNAFEINTTSLSLQGRYRLGVSIPNRGEYLSEFKSVLITPAIDSMTWVILPDRLSAYVELTTHRDNADPSDTSRLYCKWNYHENWESPSVFMPYLEWDVKMQRVKDLTDEERLERYYCFSERESSEVCIGGTEKLSENVIYKHIITKIANNDSRAKALYSISVRQQALDKEAYEYWGIMKKNSDNIGGIFAAQPTEVKGNVTNTSNPAEQVVGYVNVATVQTHRVFIDWKAEKFYKSGCVKTQIPETVSIDAYISAGYRLTHWSEVTERLWGSKKHCVDCRIYSNSTRPTWWPNDKYGQWGM